MVRRGEAVRVGCVVEGDGVEEGGEGGFKGANFLVCCAGLC